MRGARSTATKERAPQLHARQDAEAVPAPQRRVGGADASAEERPGAALACADAGSRSAAREHPRRVRRRARERRDQALQRPRDRARTARPRRCLSNLLDGRASPQRASASGGDAPEVRGACAQRSGALHVSRRQPNGSPLGCGALHGARQREVRGGAPGARRARARTFLAPRAGAAGGAFSPRRPQAPCGARLRAVLLVDAHDTRSRRVWFSYWSRQSPDRLAQRT